MAKSVVIAVAAIWAILVGGLMAGVAAFVGVDEPDVLLIGVLGGLGSAAAVFVLSSRK
jgi:hypothetical protein